MKEPHEVGPGLFTSTEGMLAEICGNELVTGKVSSGFGLR
jgi:hypothetical protein